VLLLEEYWTWDFWMVQDDDRYHLFFLMAPRSLGDPDLRHRNARVGHAVSSDLHTWEFLGEALGPGPAGSWDDVATWTGSILQVDDGWMMFYTGAGSREDGLVQRIGSAWSRDLMTWEKRLQPVVEADPRWYEGLDLASWFDLSWRDPWVYRAADGQYRMLITARANEGHRDERGVVALAVSTDLVEWEVRPPIASPREFAHMEVPQLACIDDRWYLFFSVYEWAHGPRRVAAGQAVAGTHYLVGDSPEGPFALTDDEFLCGDPIGELYAGRVVRNPQGEWVFLAFLQFVDGGPFVGGLSDPIPLVVEAGGRLRLERVPVA
jgi:beta-fructofuranosidase